MSRATRVGILFVATVALATGTAVAAGADTKTFDYTGQSATFVVPDNVCSVTVDAVGAQGGKADGTSDPEPSVGGAGGRVQATIAVTPGETLTVNVGGKGGDGISVGDTYESTGGDAGVNGGAAGGGAGAGGKTGGGGGGASDVRQASGGSGCVACPSLPTGAGNTAADRVIVAGGGGGAGGWSGNGGESGLGTPGGAGGGVSAGTPDGDGADGGFEPPNDQQGGDGGIAGASGGTGGEASDVPGTGTNGADGTAAGAGGTGGAFPAGHNLTPNSGGGGGGGGGYVGGGGGGAVAGTEFGTGGAGGGGSSFAAAAASGVTLTAGYNADGNGSVKLTWSTSPAQTCVVAPVVIEPKFTG